MIERATSSSIVPSSVTARADCSPAERQLPTIAFMVYESRSGSTLLSRELAAKLSDVVVTPEIAFNSILRRNVSALEPSDWPELIDGLYAGYDFFNSPLTRGEALNVVMPEGIALGLREGLVALIEAMAAEQTPSDLGATQAIVVKNGTTIRDWRALQKLFGMDLHLIFVYRDPRAVINSKLRTPRPYHPEETMAWGGSLLAAWQWKRYSQIARHAAAAGVRVTEVRYEDFMTVPDLTLHHIAAALGVHVLVNARDGAYRIPEDERGIHKLVEQGGIERDRVDAWLIELSARDRAAIEALIEKEMRLRGYGTAQPVSLARRVARVARCLPDLTARLLRHGMYIRGRISKQARLSEERRMRGRG